MPERTADTKFGRPIVRECSSREGRSRIWTAHLKLGQLSPLSIGSCMLETAKSSNEACRSAGGKKDNWPLVMLEKCHRMGDTADRSAKVQGLAMRRSLDINTAVLSSLISSLLSYKQSAVSTQHSWTERQTDPKDHETLHAQPDQFHVVPSSSHLAVSLSLSLSPISSYPTQ